MADDETDLDQQSLAYRFGLSARQVRFVHEYLVDFNATRAAERAGYSVESRCAGSQIMSRGNVRQAINEELDRLSRQYRAEQDRIIQELMSLGFAQIADFVKISGGKVRFEDFDELTRVQRAAVKKVKHTEHFFKGDKVSEAVELELESKVRPLELLGKHVGMFRGQTVETNRGAFAKWSEEQRRIQAEVDSKNEEGRGDDGTEE